MARKKKAPARFKNTEETIKALEDTLNVKFTKWEFKQGNTPIDFFIRSKGTYEDLIIDNRKEMQIYATLKDGNGNPIKEDYKNQMFPQFSASAIKGNDFDELFDFTVELVNKNRDLRRKESNIDPDGQMWLF